MAYPLLEQYLARLRDVPGSVWLDAHGRAHGRFFNATLTSAFQSVRLSGSGQIAGFEGLARSQAGAGHGLSLWRLLDHAASDEESIALDRLCRMLHAINFFRQPGAHGRDLYLSVHGRLLAAVEDDHGAAFRRVLAALGLPHEKIVLQLPAVTPAQGWLLDVVTHNYRRNGFRLALNASGVAQAVALLEQLRPALLKLDMRQFSDEAGLTQLVRQAGAHGVRLLFKRVETPAALAMLQRVSEQGGQAVLLQGHAWDVPAAALDAPARADAA